MIYDWRVYTSRPGKFESLRDRFLKETVPLLERHGLKVVGVFQPVNEENALCYMTACSDEHSHTAAWDAFKADPDWQSIKRASEADGPLLDSQSSMLMTPLVDEIIGQPKR